MTKTQLTHIDDATPMAPASLSHRHYTENGAVVPLVTIQGMADREGARMRIIRPGDEDVYLEFSLRDVYSLRDAVTDVAAYLEHQQGREYVG